VLAALGWEFLNDGGNPGLVETRDAADARLEPDVSKRDERVVALRLLTCRHPAFRRVEVVDLDELDRAAMDSTTGVDFVDTHLSSVADDRFDDVFVDAAERRDHADPDRVVGDPDDISAGHGRDADARCIAAPTGGEQHRRGDRAGSERPACSYHHRVPPSITSFGLRSQCDAAESGMCRNWRIDSLCLAESRSTFTINRRSQPVIGTGTD